MHRTDGDQHVSNLFNDGDPGVPRLPTQITSAWLNDVQEELVNVVLEAGIALVKGTQTQLRSALQSLYVRTADVAQNVNGVKTFLKGLVITQSVTGGDGLTAAGNGSGYAVRATAPDGSGGGGVRAESDGGSFAVHAIAEDGNAIVAENNANPNNAAFRIVPGNAPATGQPGALWVDTANSKLMIWSVPAGNWVVVGSQT